MSDHFVTVTHQTQFKITMKDAARAFTEAGAEEQAEFLVTLGAEVDGWTAHSGQQWLALGRELAKLEPSKTTAIRDFLRSVLAFTEDPS
jgi:hypothetical protein